MLRYGKGDVQAFEVLYRRYKDALYRFVRRHCRDQEVAADLVQDIWMKVIRARQRYRVRARFRTYLFTLARHCLIDAHRAQRAHLCPAALDATLDDGGHGRRFAGWARHAGPSPRST
jgi:RNA polymerase sigma factor (sigma-70 family)